MGNNSNGGDSPTSIVTTADETYDHNCDAIVFL